MPGLCMRASAACPRVRASLPRPTGGRKADAHSQACIKSLQCRTAAGRGKFVTHLLAQPNDDVTPASQQPDEAQPDIQFRLIEPPAQTASRGNQSECQHIVALRLYNNEEKEGEPPRSSLAHLQSKCQPAFIWRRLFTLLWAAFIWTVTFGAMVTAMFSADEVQMPMFLDGALRFPAVHGVWLLANMALALPKAIWPLQQEHPLDQSTSHCWRQFMFLKVQDLVRYPVHYLAGQVGASHAAHLIATRTNATEKPSGWTWISVWAIRAAFIVLGLFHIKCELTRPRMLLRPMWTHIVLCSYTIYLCNVFARWACDYPEGRSWPLKTAATIM